MNGDSADKGSGAAVPDVIVVGGGVSGLTTAMVLADRGHRVRVWSAAPAADTTSAVAGALWWPYRIEPLDRVGDWSLATLRWYEELAARPRETGVRLVEGVHRGERLAALGPWAGQVNDVVETAEGLRCRLPLIDMPVHLEWLEGRVRAAGGAVERRTVTSFDEAAAEAATVVNCTGLGARELVPDPGMRPVRGQLVLVENPGIEEWFTEADPASSETTYFFPSRAGWCSAVRQGPTTGARRPIPVRRRRSWPGAPGSARRSPGRGSSGTGWACGRPGTPGCGSSPSHCPAAGAWCTTTGTGARA